MLADTCEDGVRAQDHAAGTARDRYRARVVCERARERGETDGDVPAELVLDTLVGAVLWVRRPSDGSRSTAGHHESKPSPQRTKSCAAGSARDGRAEPYVSFDLLPIRRVHLHIP